MVRLRRLEEHYPEACQKLIAWGRWSHEATGLGYPRMSIEQAAHEGGGIDTRGSGLVAIIENPEVERVEKIILRLAARNHNQYKAVKLYFLHNHFTIKKLTREMAPLGETKVRSILKEGVSWIDGGLCN